MPVLTSTERKLLDDACVQGRRASEQAVRAALRPLAITAERPPAHLGEDDRRLRRGLRAKARLLGDHGDEVDLLVLECAFEQWHRLLFARFLAESDLLIHPEYRAPVTLEDCEELAESLGEPDGWAVASRFAAQILPGIFRLDDPCAQLRLAPEGRLALEVIVSSLAQAIFRGDDALGWVYQYWQKEQKDEVNDSERKVGGTDLGPVTQLFTENYMVRFLLENSLGAWWASLHPDSPLVAEWEYLRVDDDGEPVAGPFAGWPNTAAEVTVIDPCCGSGHFLVDAFEMLSKMRAEEEGIDPIAAQDAVLRDNLFGLELDPRCVQIAMFGLALKAWKTAKGWRQLSVPNVGCSGTPVRAPVVEWTALSGGDQVLKGALARLHILFRDADTLGSLIDPARVVEGSGPAGPQRSLEDAAWEDIAPLLSVALMREVDDPASKVLGADAAGVARAADYLSRTYTLVITNPPFLSRGKQHEILRAFSMHHHDDAKSDLSATFLSRLTRLVREGSTIASVSPQTLLMQPRYAGFRKQLLLTTSWRLVARLGDGAFSAFGGAVVNVLLGIWEVGAPSPKDQIAVIDAQSGGPQQKARVMRTGLIGRASQEAQLQHPAGVATLEAWSDLPLLAEYADGLGGITTGDSPRFRRCYWEVPEIEGRWIRQQGTPPATEPYTGRDLLLDWSEGQGDLVRAAAEGRATIAGRGAWGRRGVAVQKMGDLPVTLYDGDPFENVAVVISPKRDEHLPAIWHFASSGALSREVRAIDKSVGVSCNTMVKVPFDIEHWQKVADDAGPLPEPCSNDPSQWLFAGCPKDSSEPLQVGVGRLLGFRWPEQQESDDLAPLLIDGDGIVCLPSVRGERPAADRLQDLLAREFGTTWSPARTREMLTASGSKKRDLDTWLRDDFFRAHCQFFRNRPFVWQIWDGRTDGFSVLVNYHRLDRSTLEKLTYSYLGDWIERQVAGVRDDVAGAEERVAAARALQRKLELILEGEPPYDIYVRWKAVAEQPIGWEPDLNDGVRLNVRPFVEAGVLRAKFNVKWDKDRGKNPDGSERLNDLHYTPAHKQAARGGRG